MENEEVKKCCGGCGCGAKIPETTYFDDKPTIEAETLALKSTPTEANTALTSELQGLPPEELKNKLEELFAVSKQHADERKEASDKDHLLVAAEEVNMDDYEERELPNGMVLKVRKGSDLTPEKLARMVPVEIDVDMGMDDDDFTRSLDDGPAESDYKPGQLRHLKSLVYPADTSGQDAQARLNTKYAQKKNSEQLKLDDNGDVLISPEIPKLEVPPKNDVWANIQAMANILEENRQESEYIYETGPFEDPKKTQEREEIRKIQQYFRFDLGRSMSDPKFKVKVEDELARLRKVEVGDITYYATHGESAAEISKLIETCEPVPDKAGDLRRKETEEKRVAVLAEREHIRKLTDDIIPISPIENPSFVRRIVRTLRRSWFRFGAWWRL